MQTATNRIKELHDEIMLHRHGYYNKDLDSTDPDYIPITDDQFDELCDELEKLDPEDAALTDIGSEVSSDWPKVKHAIVAGSLTKAKNPEAITKWIADTFETTNSIFFSEKIRWANDST